MQIAAPYQLTEAPRRGVIIRYLVVARSSGLSLLCPNAINEWNTGRLGTNPVAHLSYDDGRGGPSFPRLLPFASRCVVERCRLPSSCELHPPSCLFLVCCSLRRLSPRLRSPFDLCSQRPFAPWSR